MAIFKTKTKKENPDLKKKEMEKEKEKEKNLSAQAEEIQKKTEKVTLKKEPMAWRSLKAPYISEKATSLVEENKYIFVVKDKANKNEIRNAIEELYKVNILNVNIIKIHRKKKRLGKFHGWKKGFKKAIVEVKKGQKIDIYPS